MGGSTSAKLGEASLMLNKAVELHAEAAAEYDAAFDWYRKRSPDAARKFDAEVDHAV
jgi:hypothetical protein